MLESLGGFSDAYSPFYWEDADLGYRAWKRGWKSLYQPAGTVYHQHASSISKIKSSFVDRIKTRNALFFLWRNIEDMGLVRDHRLWLPLVLARRGIVGDRAFLRGWLDAYLRRNEANKARVSDSVNRTLSDSEIMRITGAQYK
jgi:GT2 family glycosyltransferase